MEKLIRFYNLTTAKAYIFNNRIVEGRNKVQQQALNLLTDLGIIRLY